MVKYKTFQTKIFGSEALVAMASCMLFALLFVTDLSKARWIIGLNLFLFALLGYQLVLSVKKEILQRELLQKKDLELEEINAQQESLLHFITHEVKGYLTKSKAMFAAIVEGDFPNTPENLKSMAGQALADTQKGVETVRDILDSSNLKRGTTEYIKAPFNLKVTVEESVKEFGKVTNEKGLALNLDIKPGEYTIIGDEAKIRRHVIRNLIDNALKYTPRGSIDVTLNRSGSTCIFKVKDSGVGINSIDMKKLFTQGGKGTNSTRVNVDSTGYGLFIAKVIVEAHRGSIAVASGGEGEGSTFVVTLPL
jgi:signal transduction histidine kinase